MRDELKKEIFALNKNDSDYFLMKRNNLSYDDLIYWGVYTESGENYCLFIFKNIFDKIFEDYCALLFLYSQFSEKYNHVNVITSQTFYAEEHKVAYRKAAARFIEKEYSNTLTITSKISKLYKEMKDLIDEHVAKEKEMDDSFKGNNTDLTNSSVTVEEVFPEPVKPGKSYDDSEIKDFFDHLTDPLERIHYNPSPVTGQKKMTPAVLGFCLIIDSTLIAQYQNIIPLIIPLKKDGSYQTPKPFTEGNLEKYYFENLPQPVKDYLSYTLKTHHEDYFRESEMGTYNRFYFGVFSRIMMEMPDDLTFVTNSKQSKYFPLKKRWIKKIDMKFVNSFEPNRLEFFPVITDENGELFTPGRGLICTAFDKNNVAMIFKNPSREDFYLFVPDQPEKYYLLIRFLKIKRSFPTYNLPKVVEALKKIESDCIKIHSEPLPYLKFKMKPIPIIEIYKKDPPYLNLEFDYQSILDEYEFPNYPHALPMDYTPNLPFQKKCFSMLKGDPYLMPGYHGSDYENEGEYDDYYDIEYDDEEHDDFDDDSFSDEFSLGRSDFYFKDKSEVSWLTNNAPKYLEKGFKIYDVKNEQFIGKTNERLYIEYSCKTDWLEFHPLLRDIPNGQDQEINLNSINLDEKYVTDSKGNLHLISKEDIEKLKKMKNYAEPQGNFFRIPRSNYFLIDEFYDRRLTEIPELKEQLRLLNKLKNFKEIKNYPISPKFKAQLRKYQNYGFQWLQFLDEYGLSGCLADDMGLGKTVQTLAHLQTLKDEKRLKTSLLVIPVSTINNWENEIERFTEGFSVYRYHGTSRDKNTELWSQYDLIITSYGTLRNDIETFKQFKFNVIILDEAQNIKNLTSQVSRAIKLLQSHRRIALSGTPIENNVMELWSLFDFLLPGYLGTQNWFKNEWAAPIEKKTDTQKTEMLKKMIYPFLLRRKKEEVEKELPAKIEIVTTLKMEEEQARLYIETARYYKNEISKSIEDKGLEKSFFKVLEGMLRLRQICLFPQLIDPRYSNIPSIKFDHFTGMLEDILAENHKVLIFSQFVNVLEFLRSDLENKKLDYSYINGSMNVKTRGTMIQKFQEDDKTRIFLLSLKAGGVGINLTAADYVILFDPWWNPAVEAQAIDRSHRIGQTKKVMVYRMVVSDSIEDKMLSLQEQKRELVESLITSESKSFKNLTPSDIIKLFDTD